MENVRMKIRIWDVRNEKGMSIRELAEKAHVPRSTLSRIENEENPPRLDVLEKIAIALDVRISDLYESDYK